jgi:hypothetical protein
MWEPSVFITLILGAVTILSNVIAITVFVVTLGKKIDVNNTAVMGEIRVISARVGNVETSLTDLKNTDRRLSLVEDRQGSLANRQGNMEKDNLLIREDLGKLHQGLDRHVTSLGRFNDTQFKP